MNPRQQPLASLFPDLLDAPQRTTRAPYARCPMLNCPTCYGKVIHQGARGAHESSSEWGQYIHDDIKRDFGFTDVDGLAHRWIRGMPDLVRLIEHKPAKQGKWWRSKTTQLRLLSIMAGMMEREVAAGRLHPQSGTFVIIEGAETVGEGALTVHRLFGDGAIGEGVELRFPAERIEFEACRPIPANTFNLLSRREGQENG